MLMVGNLVIHIYSPSACDCALVITLTFPNPQSFALLSPFYSFRTKVAYRLFLLVIPKRLVYNICGCISHVLPSCDLLWSSNYLGGSYG